jgi:ribosomal 30S subunit maturation factor RimM
MVKRTVRKVALVFGVAVKGIVGVTQFTQHAEARIISKKCVVRKGKTERTFKTERWRLRNSESNRIVLRFAIRGG